MKQWSWLCRGVLASLLTVLASTAIHAAADDSAEQRIRDSLAQSLPQMPVVSVEKTEAGLYEVELENGPTVHVTPDAGYFVLGDLFRLGPAGLANLMESKRNAMRVAELAKVPREQAIIFSPKSEPRAVVTIFTDVECPWCQRQHEEVPALNAMGVEVRYLAYPRAGEGSPAYRKMVSAWCAEDPRLAMDRLKKLQPIPEKLCRDNPVAAQFELGEVLGVRGTPALITQDGRLLPGYLPAAKLAVELGLRAPD